jgi:hypothetical protein
MELPPTPNFDDRSELRTDEVGVAWRKRHASLLMLAADFCTT